MMKKGIGILLYLILMAVFLKFDLRLLFDLRQLLLVLFGTVLLFLPSLREQGGKDKERLELLAADKGKIISRVKVFFEKEQVRIGQNAVWAGLLQTFVLLFLNMNIAEKGIGNLQTVAVSCRPILYGFCIWIILQESGLEEHPVSDGSANDGKLADNKPAEVLQTAVDYRQCLQDLGLTKREVEIAFHVIQNETNAEIAERLFISETTVKKHLSNIFSKLGISQRRDIKECCIAYFEGRWQGADER